MSNEKIVIEIVIETVIIIQLYHTFNVRSKISKFKKIFSSDLFLKTVYIKQSRIGADDFDLSDLDFEDNRYDQVFNRSDEDETIKLSLIDTKGENGTVKAIKHAINNYLINNYGSVVNFSIIKDIIDREIEVEDEEITQSVSIPLYLGLASTMIGIVIGLFFMQGSDISNSSSILITGVKIAMIGSFTGLICTTSLSSFLYKGAKSIVQRTKNKQLTYLQSKLLPELIKSGDTGVSGLKASLDRFARVATNISDNIITAANQTGENLTLQKEVIQKVNNMEVTKISKWNLDLFAKMDSNMEAFTRFSTYLTSMEQIASQLSNFADRTSNIDKVVKDIDSTLTESRDLTKFLSTHLKEVEDVGAIALKSVGTAESHFVEAVESLKNRTDKALAELYKEAGEQETGLKSVYENIEKDINNITSQYIENFKEAYSNSTPKFDKLDNLELIQEINDSIKNMKNNQLLLNKLSSIEESIKLNSVRKTYNPRKDLVPDKKDNEMEEPVSLGKVIKKIF